jgi:hypothetical protein
MHELQKSGMWPQPRPQTSAPLFLPQQLWGRWKQYCRGAAKWIEVCGGIEISKPYCTLQQIRGERCGIVFVVTLLWISNWPPRYLSEFLFGGPVAEPVIIFLKSVISYLLVRRT